MMELPPTSFAYLEKQHHRKPPIEIVLTPEHANHMRVQNVKTFGEFVPDTNNKTPTCDVALLSLIWSISACHE
jgi:hypothetical protein